MKQIMDLDAAYRLHGGMLWAPVRRRNVTCVAFRGLFEVEIIAAGISALPLNLLW